jgi:signal transduction histidine kinase
VRASTQLFKRLETLQYQFLETQENTARRFSHELHDELGQSLTAVKANLATLRDSADSNRVNDCMALVDEAIQNVREMSQLLRPTILDDFGLDAALGVLTDSFAKRTGLRMKYESSLVEQLPDAIATNFYRIAQEALTNIARHSQATAVEISVGRRPNNVAMEIRDNGKGIDLAAQRRRSGLGLAGMQTRARGCGGTVRIDSTPGKGLRIEVTCPIER